MTVFPVLIDWRPQYLANGGSAASLLLLPLGAETLGGRLRRRLRLVTDQQVSVLTMFEPDARYERQITDIFPEGLFCLVPAERFGELLEKYEPADWLLMVDTRWSPAEGFDFVSMTSDAKRMGSILHLVTIDSGTEGTRELALAKAGDRIRRIQRYYAGLTWCHTAGIAVSIASAASVAFAGAGRFESLEDLRERLVHERFASVDIVIRGEAMYLPDEADVLRLQERILRRLGATDLPEDYRQEVEGIFIAADCTVSEDSRLYGPIVVQSGTTIGDGAVIVGPAVLGTRCRVGAGAVVAQSVLMPDAVVPDGAVLRQQVVCGECDVAGSIRAPVVLIENNSAGADEGRLEFASLQGLEGDFGRWIYTCLKRLTDIVIAGFGLLLLMPLFLLVAVLIKLDSRGPVLFTHEREGKGGRSFRCFKFRTMVQGAHAQQRNLYAGNMVDGPQFKLEQDPRVTRVGAVLRTTNIDELPQLINVLLGHMSLIGPRPSPFRENQICVPWRQARLSVRPGITGLWQVCRTQRWAGDFHQWIYYDMLYVRHMSLLLDLKILLATVLTLGGKWAVPVNWMIPARRLHEVRRRIEGLAEPDCGAMEEAGAEAVERLAVAPGA